MLTVGFVFNGCEKDDPAPTNDSTVTGCMDEDATNYDADATEACSDDCCEYDDDQTCSVCGNDPCTCSGDDCLMVGTWAVSHAEDDEGYCYWYCGDDFAPSDCEAYDDDYDYFCLAVEFSQNGDLEIGMNNGDYEDIEYGTWSGGCEAGDEIFITIVDEDGDADTESFGVIIAISSDVMMIDNEGLIYTMLNVE